LRWPSALLSIPDRRAPSSAGIIRSLLGVAAPAAPAHLRDRAACPGPGAGVRTARAIPGGSATHEPESSPRTPALTSPCARVGGRIACRPPQGDAPRPAPARHRPPRQRRAASCGLFSRGPPDENDPGVGRKGVVHRYVRAAEGACPADLAGQSSRAVPLRRDRPLPGLLVHVGRSCPPEPHAARGRPV